MNDHTDTLARRRIALQLQCAMQREQFARHAAGLKEGLEAANHGIAIVRGLRIMPVIMAATSVVGIISRGRGLVRLLGRAWFIISTLRRLRGGQRRSASRSASRRSAERAPRR